MPKWEILPDDYFSRIGSDPKDFETRLCLPIIPEVRKIIPLRDIRKIQTVIPMTVAMLDYLVRHSKTLDGDLPFAHAELSEIESYPKVLEVGQRFIFREKWIAILEEFPKMIKGSPAGNGGLKGINACFIFGYDETGAYVMACYLPPLIEMHGSKMAVMDGIHRSWIAMSAGTMPKAILIKHIQSPFPCGLRPWEATKVISVAEKPPRLEDRYFEMQKGLFRDLKHLGIDG